MVVISVAMAASNSTVTFPGITIGSGATFSVLMLRSEPSALNCKKNPVNTKRFFDVVECYGRQLWTLRERQNQRCVPTGNNGGFIITIILITYSVRDT